MGKFRAVYCHFSFRRPKGKGYGIFATALYADKEGKILVAAKTRAYSLWQDQQHVTAIQSYEHALYCIWEWQAELHKRNITNVLLVTNNSTLAGWIENPRKNKAYTKYMNWANDKYKVGGKKEIYLTVGLCEPLDYEKSYKFCTEDKVVNKIPTNGKVDRPIKNKIDIGDYQSIQDVLNEDIPEGVEDMDDFKADRNNYIID